MQRGIKFRAWNIVQKRWEKKLGLYFDDGKIGDFSDCFHNEEDSSSYVVQQFTGLQDYKNNDLYEGDIVLLDAVEKLEIIFYEGSFMLKDRYGDYPRFLGPVNYCCELIGNIFENPELLK
jgi:hypothetical protein